MSHNGIRVSIDSIPCGIPPDRKYYRLATTFSISMAFSRDGFSIRNNKIIELWYKEFEKLYKEYEKSVSDYYNK